VGTRRADADLEQVEDAHVHAVVSLFDFIIYIIYIIYVIYHAAAMRPGRRRYWPACR
jgi:hypothetical protein